MISILKITFFTSNFKSSLTKMCRANTLDFLTLGKMAKYNLLATNLKISHFIKTNRNCYWLRLDIIFKYPVLTSYIKKTAEKIEKFRF